MARGQQAITAEKFDILNRYLIEADIYLLEDDKYDEVKERFIEVNSKPVKGTPGRVIPSQDAYFNTPKPAFYGSKPPKEEPGCGLPKGLLEALFLLQHVRYHDHVTKKTSRSYKADRVHFPEENRAMLRNMEQFQNNKVAEAMVSWAKRKQPILVKDKVNLALKYTPGHPGNLVFHLTGSGIVGSDEPYQEDKSHYVELDVFATTPTPQKEYFDDSSEDVNLVSILGGLKDKAKNKYNSMLKNRTDDNDEEYEELNNKKRNQDYLDKIND